MVTSSKKYQSFESSPAHTVFRAALFVFVLVIIVLEFPGAREVLYGPYSGVYTKNLTVQRISENGPNAHSGVEPGDQIYAVGGERLRNYFHFRFLVASNTDFAPQVYTIKRGEQLDDVTIRYQPLPALSILRRFAFLLVAFAFLMVGVWVYLRRPDLMGALFVSNCVALAFLLSDRPAVPSAALQIGGELIYDSVILFFPAVLLHFFHVFPGRHGRKKIKWRRRIVTIYSVPLALYLAGAGLAIRRFLWMKAPEPLVDGILILSTIYLAGYIFASLFIFIRGYRHSTPALKLKLRVVIAGTMAAFVPFLVATVVRSITPGVSTKLESVAVVCLGFLPITFAYAILKHGAIELNIVVRKSLVYAFLTGAIIAVYYALMQVISDLMVKQLGVSEFVWMPVGILVLAIVFAPARERIQRLVDRLFYRADYTYKQEVVDFNRQLARKLTREEIIACFIDKVESLLNCSYIAFYTRPNGSAYELEKTRGELPERLPTSFSSECFLGRYFSRYKTPLMVEYLDRTWERPNLDRESRQFLTTNALSVCLPIVTPDSLLGVVALGVRRSELVYRRADSELLESFAERLGLVLQNADLLMDSLQRQRLEGEVMLARDIQLSLIPKNPPENPTLAIVGQMVSSYEVGGDYFDYFPVDSRRVAIAIGDVSGKGVPAAMLMSSLRAVFKNLALKGKLGPAELNHELNQFLVENAKTEQFATFFYGVINTETSIFTFSNAGQCPALLVKDGYTDRLGEGGMVLGVRPDQSYMEGSVSIEPGDLVVLYTDGITEQTNRNGEDYGEDRLIRFLELNRNLPVAQLQDALLSDVVAFGGGSQDDDITSVIAYRKSA